MAIKSVGDLKSTRPVRALLLKGASRTSTNFEGLTSAELISPNIPEAMQNELKSMLKIPRYIECFMVKTPLVPLRKNHKTQILFVCLFIIIISVQLFVIVPSKFNFRFI